MRIRLFLAIAAASLVASSFVVEACGGSSATEFGADSGGAEASADVAVATPAKDAAADAGEPAPPCDPNKDLFDGIPDASIADGSSTTGLCLSCASSQCAGQITDCQRDCSRSATDRGCRDLAADALVCYATTQNAFGCLGSLVSAPDPTKTIGLALGGCVVGSCAAACGVSLPSQDGGATPDGATPDGAAPDAGM